MTSVDQIEDLVAGWSMGDDKALEAIMPLAYSDLRRKAERILQEEPKAQFMESTELVNELYIKLRHQHVIHFKDGRQFFHFSEMIMHRVLLDLARQRMSKRGGGSTFQVSIEVLKRSHSMAQEAITDPMRTIAMEPSTELNLDVVALRAELEKLARRDSRLSRTIELRFFAGLTIEETAETLGVSASTVKRDWATARTWLRKQLAPSQAEEAAGDVARSPFKVYPPQFSKISKEAVESRKLALATLDGVVESDVSRAISLLQSSGLGEVTIEEASRLLESAYSVPELEFAVLTVERHASDLLRGVTLLSEELGEVAGALRTDLTELLRAEPRS